MKAEIENKILFLQSLGWANPFDPDIWIHPKLEKDPDCLFGNCGMSLDDAIAYEFERMK